MRRRDVVFASVPALIVTAVLAPVVMQGVLSLKDLQAGEQPRLSGAVMPLAWFASVYVTALLGVLPVWLAAYVWPEAEAALAPKRAITAVSALVTATAAVELFVPVLLLARPAMMALAVLSSLCLLTFLVAWIALRLTWLATSSWPMDSTPRRAG